MPATVHPAPTPAGTNNIGDVDVLTLPALPAGNNNVGDVDVATLPALAAGSANIGHVDGQGTAGTPAGGVVTVQGVASGTAQPVSLATLPALAAGTANIGDVDVLTLPALPTGTNVVGSVNIADPTTPSQKAGIDANGFFRAIVPNSILTQTGTITASAQSVTSTINGSYGLTTISVRGTYATGLNLVFEVSDDGTNFFQVAAIRNDNNASEDVPILGVNDTRMWRLSTIGYQSVRVRATAWASPTGTANIRIVSSTLAGEPVNTGTSGMIPAGLAVTATAAAAAAVTLTIPAVAAQYHYLTFLEIGMYCTAARTGGATPVVVTSTNLPGSLAWTFESAQAVGTMVRSSLASNSPVKSSALNTNTTIACPGTASVIWRVNALYYTGVY